MSIIVLIVFLFLVACVQMECASSTTVRYNRFNSKIQRFLPYNSPYGNYVSSYLPKLPNHYTNLHPSVKPRWRGLKDFKNFSLFGAKKNRRSSNLNSHQFAEPTPGQVLYPPKLLQFKPQPIQKMFLSEPATKMPELYPFYAHEAVTSSNTAISTKGNRRNYIDHVTTSRSFSTKQTDPIIYTIPVKVNRNRVNQYQSTTISSKLKKFAEPSSAGEFFHPNRNDNQMLFVTPMSIKPSLNAYYGGYKTLTEFPHRNYRRKSTVLTRDMPTTTTPLPTIVTNVYTLSTLLSYASDTDNRESVTQPTVFDEQTSFVNETTDVEDYNLRNHKMDFSDDRSDEFKSNEQIRRSSSTRTMYSDDFKTVQVQPNIPWIVISPPINETIKTTFANIS